MPPIDLHAIADIIDSAAGAVMAIGGPFLIWYVRRIGADVRDIHTNHLPHIYDELKRLKRGVTPTLHDQEG